ncbi:MAG: hemolysin III family protein [Pyrinomonadaceae bacterium]
MKDRLTFYHPTEEKLNVISHGFGLILSIIALVLLLMGSNSGKGYLYMASFGIYGASLVILYTASTLYHYVQEPNLRYKLNILDHSAIYVLIAGSYTPYTLNVMNTSIGWTMFVTVWMIAIAGITLKLFFTGKYGKLSTIAYILMGWLGVFGLNSLIENLPVEGVIWLLAGGVSYTIGAILYGLKRVKFNHAIFHVFVLLGSICHFISVFSYVLPFRPSVANNIEMILK